MSKLALLEKKLNQVLLGKPEAVRLCLVALLARGHILIEDIPGIGKTTLAQGLARLLELDFQRIQFTSDLLPSDILGVAIYRPSQERFEFQPGPIFHSLVLADEINRASPRTQSALLEAMQERQISLEGKTYHLPEPFFVIATQNPLEHHGTYPLPDSQLDRFLLSFQLGYPEKESELEILKTKSYVPNLNHLSPLLSREELLELQQRTEQVKIDTSLLEYILQIVQATREHSALQLGASPRAGLALKDSAKARAVLQERDYVVPDDIKTLAVPVLRHRLIPGQDFSQPEKKIEQTEIVILEILEQIPVPV